MGKEIILTEEFTINPGDRVTVKINGVEVCIYCDKQKKLFISVLNDPSTQTIETSCK